jgi:hypothetical protein
MPDLRNRPAYEAEFASGIAQALQLQRRELEQLGIERALQADWQKQQDDLAAILFLLLLRPWERAYGGWNAMEGQIVRSDVRAYDYRQWGERHARATAERLVRTNQSLVTSTVNQFNAGLTGQPIGATATLPAQRIDFASIVDAERLLNISISEVTNAVSGGEFSAADRFTRTTGLTATAHWYTERDEKVCKICAPLHGQPFEVWAGRFPNGPTAHVRCRCYLTWVVGPRYSEN